MINGQKIPGLVFDHPEPQKAAAPVMPVFMPFAGCPGRCVYCAQNLATGEAMASPDKAFERCRELLAGLAERPGPARELAFYGGTFTALPSGWPERFLSLARPYKEQGLISRVRCSTRPDAVDGEILTNLKKQGLDLVELGIQSFDPEVLDAAGRGYGPETAHAAAKAVKSAGLALGVQLLPGLPGMDKAVFENDVAEAVRLEPECARLYPCQVIEGTALAEAWRAGEYSPWDLAGTIERLGAAVLEFWRAGVRVIRVGLAPEPDLDASVLAGPRHPALGQLARSRALYLHIAQKVLELGRAPEKLEIPERWASDVKGHAGSMLPAYEALGFGPDSMTLTRDRTFSLS